ncbi:nicotinamide riboside transporter PnuC [Pedobacter gandavensis]|uniref:nicotinamide riboside transporter PnuC n=1 Tax=Pedobacter TaxID=84567 RepID=UPI001C9A0AC2|nr:MULTISPECIES: nicotinamide riboside transporter PnuC [Pedobacter]WGQ07963.1 nicotinamide riboside transporter PnuC [Pedobacter gandavensis]
MLLLESSFFQLIADQFIHTTWLEWLGVFSGFICIYLATKENVLSWPISIISVIAYAWVFLDAKMYGDMALQFYFLFTAFYGWYFWIRKKEVNDKPVANLSRKGWWIAIGSIVILSVALGLFLDHFTDTNVPYEDGFCTAMSFVAQLMLSRKILQNWILWIIVDLCYIPLYIYKNLNLSAIFYAFLVAIAIKGYIDWRKTYRREQAN